MTPTNDKNKGIKTVDTVFDVIEVLHESGTLGVTEVAKRLGIANSTAHGHLSSLQERGYVVKRKDGQYDLSLRFLDVGASVRRRWKVNEEAKEPLENAAENTNEVAWLIVEENGYAVHIRKAVGRKGIQAHGWVGRHPHMHHLASGKAILAHLPEKCVDEIIEKRGLPEKTKETITERDELFEKLAEIRERGYAYNDEETYHGLRCIGAPIIPHGEGVVGAVSICGPSHRFSENHIEAEIREELLECTNEIELRMSHD